MIAANFGGFDCRVLDGFKDLCLLLSQLQSNLFLMLLLVYGTLPLIIHGPTTLRVLQVLGEAAWSAVSSPWP